MHEKVRNFIEAYGLFTKDTVQQVQLQHRMALVDAFQIDQGMSILEVGCGQGDTTVVLADAVGEAGHVLALDIAPASYGAPLTLGEATGRIQDSSLGKRIEFRLETDVFTLQEEKSFDLAILSHCSWYMKDPSELLAMIRHLRLIAKRVCFAEWDIDFTHLSQRPHFFAASISELHAQYIGNDGNVQRIYRADEVMGMFREAGFQVDLPQLLDATYLQDGEWEVDIASDLLDDFSNAPVHIQTLAERYGHLMNAGSQQVSSLNSFLIWAW